MYILTVQIDDVQWGPVEPLPLGVCRWLRNTLLAENATPSSRLRWTFTPVPPVGPRGAGSTSTRTE